MHFEGTDQIEKIASASGFSIFELTNKQDQSLILPKAIHIRKEPDDSSIKIEQIQKISELTSIKQESDLYFVVEDADLMTTSAANSFLKKLEEPNDHIHYVFLTKRLNKILPTIKSRAFCYIQNRTDFDPESIDIKIRAQVKDLLQAKPQDLNAIADVFVKDKKAGRQKALEFLRYTNELCLASFYKTGNKLFLEKAQKAANAHDAIEANGNIRIQLIACML